MPNEYAVVIPLPCQECPGEDPHVTSVFAREYVRGMQGDDPSGILKTVCTPKHFVGQLFEGDGSNPWGNGTTGELSGHVVQCVSTGVRVYARLRVCACLERILFTISSYFEVAFFHHLRSCFVPCPSQ